MAGTKDFNVYHSDDGNTYCVSMPHWESLMQGTAPTTCTTEPPLPTGYERRKRDVQYDSTLKENPITVLSVADVTWTAAIGTAVKANVPPDFGALSGTNNAKLMGAIGERRLKRL